MAAGAGTSRNLVEEGHGFVEHVLTTAADRDVGAQLDQTLRHRTSQSAAASGVGDEDAGITTTEPDTDAGDIPVPTADASVDATTSSPDAAAPPAVDAGAAPPSEPEPEGEDDHEHDDDTHRDYEDRDSDNEPGEQDSIGAGLRDARYYSNEPSPTEGASACAATPMSRTQSSGVAGGFALALAAVMIRRRRR